MEITVADDEQAVALGVASFVAGALTAAVSERGRAIVAFSGGSTPVPMLRHLAGAAVDWSAVTVFQVDERVAPDGDPERNATALTTELIEPVGAQAYLMPVTRGRLGPAAESYALLIGDVCGGVLDVAHLGLGTDGHTASLVPGDPVVDERAADVAITGVYKGHRRMTMTLPLLNRARTVVWQVAGEDKAEAVAQLVAGGDIPAARVCKDRARLFVDAAAAQALPSV